MNHFEFNGGDFLRDIACGILITDAVGIIQHINPAAERLLEISAKKATGRPIEFAVPFPGENQDFLRNAEAGLGGDTSETTVSYTTETGTKRILMQYSPLKKERERSGAIFVLNDMERLRAADPEDRSKEIELRNQLLSETLGRYLSEEIVDQLINTPNGLALNGKKSYVTVLMSDLRGFTVMSEHMDADDLLFMLNQYLSAMTDIIQKYRGTIIEFIGDGIMAVFGAPIHSKYHAADAVAAAVAMQAKMTALNKRNKRMNFPILEMGIGIHTGDAIIGNIGGEKRIKYGAVGRTVNLAGRIEGYTVGGQIMITTETRKNISCPLDIVSEQEVYPKGLSKPLTVSEVAGIGEPYGISCRRQEEPLKKLKKPAEITFLHIENKHIGNDLCSGKITKLSHRGAALETDTPLDIYDNLQLDFGGTVFAKVTEAKNGIYLLSFTSLHGNFEELLKKLTAEP